MINDLNRQKQLINQIFQKLEKLMKYQNDCCTVCEKKFKDGDINTVAVFNNEPYIVHQSCINKPIKLSQIDERINKDSSEDISIYNVPVGGLENINSLVDRKIKKYKINKIFKENDLDKIIRKL